MLEYKNKNIDESTTGRYISTTVVKRRRRKKRKRKKEKKKKKKKGEKSFAMEGLSKGVVWMVGGAYAQDPQGWKRPWGL